MPKNFITSNNGLYSQRSWFSFSELLPQLPKEMLAAKGEIPNALCHGQFHVNSDRELICSVTVPRDGEPRVTDRYYWSNNAKRWRHF